MMLLTVAAKTLKEAFRTPRTVFLGLGLPVAFMLIFGLAFGESSESPTYEIAVLDHDTGTASDAYLAGLANLTYPDGKALARLTPLVDEAAARPGVEDRTYHLVLTIPADFTEGLTPGQQTMPPQGPLGQPTTRPTRPEGSEVAVLGDPTTPRFQGAYQVVQAYNQEFAARASGEPPLVATTMESAVSRELTSFDFMAPGLMVFAILNLAPQAAATMARETELRTIDRIRASPVRASVVLGGVALAQLVLASIALTLMLATAALMGFHNQGSYAAAFAIAFGAAVAVMGLGMLIASFVKTQQEAANLGIFVSVPASFLSGAFFPVPGVDLFEAGGRTVGLYDILPTTHAIDAMRDVMTYGRGLDAVTTSLGFLALLAVLFFALGVGVFARNRLAPE